MEGMMIYSVPKRNSHNFMSFVAESHINSAYHRNHCYMYLQSTHECMLETNLNFSFFLLSPLLEV